MFEAFYISATACLLIVCQILTEKCGLGEVKCGPLHKDGYLQVIISVSSALQIILLIVYSSKYTCSKVQP